MLTTALYHYDDDEIIFACKSHCARDYCHVLIRNGQAEKRKSKRSR